MNRDFSDERLQSISKVVWVSSAPKLTNNFRKTTNSSQFTVIPNCTPKKQTITIFRLTDFDANKFDFCDFMKLYTMISDAAFVTPASDLTVGEISVFDCKGFGARHFWKVLTNYSALQLFLRYVQEAVPFVINQNHYVNCSPIMMKLLALVRPFVRKELFDVMHFHSNGFGTLYEHMPSSVLPIEYGGYGGEIDDMYKRTLLVLERQNEYLKNDTNWQLLDWADGNIWSWKWENV